MKSAQLIVVFAALASPFAYADECLNWQTNHPEWLWCDDFEDTTTTLTQRYEDVGAFGMAVSDTTGLNNSKGLTQKYTKGQVEGGWIVKYKSQGYPTHVFYRYYHKYGAGYTTYPPKLSRIGYRNHSTWAEIMRVHSWLTSSGTLTADVLAKNSTSASGGWLPIANSNFSFASRADQWVGLEVETKLNTPGLKDGLYRLWVDDKLVIERTNVDLRGSTSDPINEVMLDCYWNGGAPAALARHYDNFVISTQKIGLIQDQTQPSPPMPPTDLKAEKQ